MSLENEYRPFPGNHDPEHFSCNVWVSQSSEEMLRVFLEQLIRLLISMLFFIYDLKYLKHLKL